MALNAGDQPPHMMLPETYGRPSLQPKIQATGRAATRRSTAARKAATRRSRRAEGRLIRSTGAPALRAGERRATVLRHALSIEIFQVPVGQVDIFLYGKLNHQGARG